MAFSAFAPKMLAVEEVPEILSPPWSSQSCFVPGLEASIFIDTFGNFEPNKFPRGFSAADEEASDNFRAASQDNAARDETSSHKLLES